MKLKTKRQKRLEQIREHFTDARLMGVEATKLFVGGLWFSLPYIAAITILLTAVGFLFIRGE